MTEQGQSPFASAEIEPCGAAAADFTSPGSSGWNEALCAPGNLAEQVFMLCAKLFSHVRLFTTKWTGL